MSNSNEIAIGVAYLDQDIIGSNYSLVSAQTGQLGYNTGSATAVPAAVTQATSKSTGVTINAPCGTITMNNAAMLTTAIVSFTVTNSYISAYDIPVIAIKSGGTAGGYSMDIGSVAAGSFSVTMQNITGSTLTEALVLSFAIVHVAQQ